MIRLRARRITLVILLSFNSHSLKPAFFPRLRVAAREMRIVCLHRVRRPRGEKGWPLNRHYPYLLCRAAASLRLECAWVTALQRSAPRLRPRAKPAAIDAARPFKDAAGAWMHAIRQWRRMPPFPFFLALVFLLREISRLLTFAIVLTKLFGKCRTYTLQVL